MPSPSKKEPVTVAHSKAGSTISKQQLRHNRHRTFLFLAAIIFAVALTAFLTGQDKENVSNPQPTASATIDQSPGNVNTSTSPTTQPTSSNPKPETSATSSRPSNPAEISAAIAEGMKPLSPELASGVLINQFSTTNTNDMQAVSSISISGFQEFNNKASNFVNHVKDLHQAGIRQRHGDCGDELLGDDVCR